MVTIYNSNLSKAIVDATKAAIGKEQIPTQLAEKVVPTINVNPFHNKTTEIIKNYISVNSTSGTIYTTPTNADFYLTGFSLSIIKDATSQSTGEWIQFTKDGAGVIMGHIAGITLTAQTGAVTWTFPPIKIDRNTPITVRASNAAANVTASGCILGYIVGD